MKRQRTSGLVRFLRAGAVFLGSDLADFFAGLGEDFLEVLVLIATSGDVAWERRFCKALRRGGDRGAPHSRQILEIYRCTSMGRVIPKNLTKTPMEKVPHRLDYEAGLALEDTYGSSPNAGGNI
ncbi:MAG: hypothetical protein LBB26_04455 [Puniceicoccales bacterium]|jgi:hypothetical protein|nr:hypothetical protein [Puniceicoccales bacterium]